MSDDNTRRMLRNRIKRRDFTKALLTTGAIGLAGCSGDDGGTEGDTESPTDTMGEEGPTETDSPTDTPTPVGMGKELVVGLNFPPQNLDPSYFHDPSSQRVTTLMSEELLTVGVDNELTPRLIEEIPEAKNDATQFDYKIRDDAVFRNGDPVTAQDFKWSVEWQENEENLSPLAGRLPETESLEVVDDKTLRFNLTEESGLHPWWVASFMHGIVPEGSRDSVEESQGSSSGAVTNLSKDPTGIETGPFLFEEWNTGSHVLLKRNPDYWDEGFPKVENLRFVFVEEASTRLAQLESDRIHIVVRVPPASADRVANAPNVDKIEVPGNIFQVAYTNLQDTVNGEANPLANRHNRRALMFAIDNEELVKNVFKGRATAKQGFSFPNSPWASPKVKEMTLYDPEKAREELEMAGNPDGFEVTMTTISRSLFSDQSEVLQSMFSNVGIDAEIQPQEESAHFSRVYTQNDWHVASSYGGQGAVPLSTMRVIYGENSRNHHHWFHEAEDLPDKWEPSGPPAPEDAEGDYSNGHEWFVDVLDRAGSTPDPEERFSLTHRLEEYLIKHAIGPQLVFRNNIQAQRSKVEGYEVGTFNEEFKGATLQN